ncbi:hypothetical protein BpHYR1_000387 [Brachionus plicatilis]|uniref:Uncharacterized protein n=1 Tax=Brachionus plicatilis TaxID=10195 RepID=A0A3M7Q4R9_BRAPC|nr:hypothetical protein BpHYR1_000387 [Brachionus plicatilis]
MICTSEVEEEFVPKRARIESMSQEISDKEIKLCDQCGAQIKKHVTGLVRINQTRDTIKHFINFIIIT